MAHSHPIHHTFAADEAEFQFVIVLAGMLALAVALVYLFPRHDGANAWTPDVAVSLLAP
jgi:hypothetical protein